MRQVIVPVLMIISLLLGGCRENDKLQRELDGAREEWAAANSLSFTASVTAELSDSVFECVLECTKSEETLVVEIKSPENIAGIRARLSEGKTELEYDGLILAVGDPMKGEISPLSAMPIIMQALTEGHAMRIWPERDGEQEMLCAEVYVSESDCAKLWFDRENCNFVHAELVSDGRAVVKCEIVSFTKE